MPPIRPSNEISVRNFSKSVLVSHIAKLSGNDMGITCVQGNYLAQYLQDIGARSIVTERFYIDRHYLEEASDYYSRCLVHKPNSASRIHVFSVPLRGWVKPLAFRRSL